MHEGGLTSFFSRDSFLARVGAGAGAGAGAGFLEAAFGADLDLDPKPGGEEVLFETAEPELITASFAIPLPLLPCFPVIFPSSLSPLSSSTPLLSPMLVVLISRLLPATPKGRFKSGTGGGTAVGSDAGGDL